jgi:hypothetical protein
MSSVIVVEFRIAPGRITDYGIFPDKQVRLLLHALPYAAAGSDCCHPL